MFTVLWLQTVAAPVYGAGQVAAQWEGWRKPRMRRMMRDSVMWPWLLSEYPSPLLEVLMSDRWRAKQVGPKNLFAFVDKGHFIYKDILKSFSKQTLESRAALKPSLFELLCLNLLTLHSSRCCLYLSVFLPLSSQNGATMRATTHHYLSLSLTHNSLWWEGNCRSAAEKVMENHRCSLCWYYWTIALKWAEIHTSLFKEFPLFSLWAFS